MINVYNKSTFERNSIQSVPPGYIDNAANDLLRFMGSFWKNIHEGREFVKGLQNVRGIKAAQFYLDLLESLKLQDRNGIPVFHRELWKPLILRKSKRNKAQENLLEIGGEIVLGPQPAGSKYGEGTNLEIGKLANLDSYVTYPVEGDINSIVSGIANNVINPTVVYKIAADFPSDDVVYMNGTLIFPIEMDPFAEGSGFEVYDVVNDVRDEEDPDQEVVLWASDVLIDKDFISTHMSYALGIDCPSTDIAKRIINAGWDSLNCGLTPELLRTLIAAILNVPVIQEDEEQVLQVTEDNGNHVVVTDKHTYTVYGKAVLRDCVNNKELMHRGDLLDQSIKVYPILTDVSDAKLDGITEYSDILKTDVPVISMPRAILRTKTSNGLFVDWTPTDILWNGDYDANRHRKLYFKIGGPEADVKAFWDDVWDNAEKDNVDLDDIFTECEYVDDSSSSSSDEARWQIVPAAFFLQNMLGANTLIITLDRDQVEDASLIRNQMFFDIINKVMPSSMRLFFIEHTEIGDDHDTYTLDEPEDDGEYAVGTVDDAQTYVLEDISDDEFLYSDLPGIKGKRLPTYEDQIELKFMRNRKRTAD